MKYIHIKVCYDKNAVFADTKDANVLRTQTPMCYEYKSETPPPDKQDLPAARHIRDILKTY